VLRNAAALALLLAVVSFAAIIFFRPELHLQALAAWLILVSLGSAAFSLWNQRGLWRPSARTTRSFLELSRRRGLANMRALGWGPWTGYASSLVAVAIVVWTSQTRPATIAGTVTGVLVALVSSHFYRARVRRRYARELAEAERLLASFDDRA
jgi:hypothetical protein